MPAWMELVLNVIAFAGFVGIATYYKSPNEKMPD
jgi:hypothetical protein